MFHRFKVARHTAIVALEGETKEAYTPTLDDVGCCLMFAATPVLVDGQKGTRVFAVSVDVEAATPVAYISEFVGAVIEGSPVKATVEYSGGTQGASTMQWYRCAVDSPYAPPVVIEGATEMEYVPVNADVGHLLMFE